MILKFNPKKIVGSFQGKVGNKSFVIKFQAPMDGTFFTCDFDENAVTKHTGGQGDTTFVLNANKGSKMTVTLAQGSPDNDLLSDLIPDADNNYLPVGTLTYEDLNGTTKVSSDEAVIQKCTKIEFGTDVKGREWTFECGVTKVKAGGAGDF